MGAEEWATIPQMVFEQAKRFGEKVLFRTKVDGIYRDISWNQFVADVEKLSLALLDQGIRSGDRVGILSENRPEWAMVDVATLAVGGATVPIYTTLTSEETSYLIRHAGIHFLFVSNPDFMTKVVPFQEKLDVKVVLFDAPYRVSGPRVWWLGELLGLGNTASDSMRSLRLERMSEGKAEDVASIIYTSGTTGPPKGVMLTHRNFLSNCRAISDVLPITEKDETLSFLPLSHVFERTAGYYFVLFVGGKISYAERLDTVPENLLEVRPTIVTAVPRFYEKLQERTLEAVEDTTGLKRRIFSWATGVGKRWAQRRLAGSPVSWSIKVQYPVADRLVFSKLREHLGGRLRFFVSGGAPLAKELAEFFYAAGIFILEGYGLTETSPVISVNQPDRFRFGTVGQPLPGVDVRIAPDGEILTRGSHVMKGYFADPRATAEVIDSEGWFHTGDIGTLSPDQFLTITDRKKDLIKTSGGKMVAPQNLEALFKSDPFIADCVVIGDRKKYLTTLIVPNLQRMELFARRNSISYENTQDLVTHPKIVKLLWERVEQNNKKLAPFEQIKKVTLLAEPFTLQTGELTPTMKVKRRVVAERYASQIAAMYQE